MSAAKANDPQKSPIIYHCLVEKDEEWRTRIEKRLRTNETTGGPVLSYISPPSRPLLPGWEKSVNQELGRCHAAILYLSEVFLLSEDKGQPLLKILFEHYEEKALPIIPVLISACPWENDQRLNRFLILPADDRPLDTMRGAALEKALDLIVKEVLERVADSSPVPRRIIQMASGTLKRVPVSARQGEPFRVPKLPSKYIPRDQLMAEVWKGLFRTEVPLGLEGSRSVPTLVINGQAGIGKTVLASAFASDMETRRTFPDGVFWFRIGQKADLLEKQKQLALALNMEEPAFDSIEEALGRLRQALRTKRILLVLDDAREVDHVDAFAVLNSDSRLLITTPNSEGYAGPETMMLHLGRPSPTEALQMLHAYAGVSKTASLRYQANHIMAECGFLPLALALVGSLVEAAGSDTIDVLMLLRNHDAQVLDLSPEDPDYFGLNAIRVAVDALDNDACTRFLKLADHAREGILEIPGAHIANLWPVDRGVAMWTVTDLASRSLLAYDRDPIEVRLHDLVAEYLVRVSDQASKPSVDVKEPLEEVPPDRVPDTGADQPEQVKELLPSVSTETPGGEDQIGITQEVNAFASVLASKQLQPPLCLGIFGDWGTGKTFFMEKLKARIESLAQATKTAQGLPEPRESAYCSHIAQITFNAWHYVDANLWASLACRIFEGLDECITLPNDKSQESRHKLVQEVHAADEKLEEAKRDVATAEEAVTGAKEKIAQAEVQRDQTCANLQGVWLEAVKEELAKDPNIKQKLTDASEELGLKSIGTSMDELQKALAELSGLHGRLRAAWIALRSGRYPWRPLAATLLLIVLVPPFCGIILSWFVKSSIATQLSALFLQVGGFIAWLAVGLSKGVKVTDEVLKRLHSARQHVDLIVDSAQGTSRTKEAGLKKELIGFREDEAAARRSLEAAEEAVRQANQRLQALKKLTYGHRMAEMIRERIRSSDYQSHLGIIATIRRDFQALSKLLTAQQQDSGIDNQKTDDPGDGSDRAPERIILYIDDLDRCPEEMVVQVLQAVHLLLYFKLFVVVLAVDSRWLVLSLAKQYVALQGSNGERAAGQVQVDRADMVRTTPQNYLEKIIQIPFNLRRMDSTGFERLVTSLLPKREKGATAWSEPEPAPAVTPATPDEPHEPPADASLPVSLPAEAQPTAPEQEPRETEAEIDRITPDHEKHEPPAAQQEQEDRKGIIDLTPASLHLTEEEEQFIKGLSTMVATPRSVKRLINIYCVIRATVEDSELHEYLGENNSPPLYQPILILLSIQIGFPLVATKFFERIVVSTDSVRTWAGFITALSAEAREASQGEGTDEQMGLVLKYLTELSDLWHPELPLASFKRCIRKVDRFSFHGLDDASRAALWAEGASSRAT